MLNILLMHAKYSPCIRTMGDFSFQGKAPECENVHDLLRFQLKILVIS